MIRPGDPYMPSNGTEGMWFTEKFCDRCIHQHPDPDNERQCNDILLESLIGNQPDEWIYDSMRRPTCTNFVKWDWGRDDDEDGWNEPPGPEPYDPNQLLLPMPIHDILGLSDCVVTGLAITEA